MAHELTLTERVEATSTTAGKEAYYTCENCGRYFEDAAGSVEIANLDEYGVIPATGVTAGGKMCIRDRDKERDSGIDKAQRDYRSCGRYRMVEAV